MINNKIVKPEGAVKVRFASCIVVRSVVDFRLIMAAITPGSVSESVSRT